MNEYIASYKIRVYLTKYQKYIFKRTCGACGWIYNNYIIVNQERYSKGKKLLTGYDYSKKLTKWKKENPDYMWLDDPEISSKAIHESFMDAYDAYTRFLKQKSGFPRFKSRKRNPVNSYFFVGDKVKFKHNKVKLPILGNVRITENDYVPKDKRIIGGTLMCKNDKYYAVFRVRQNADDEDYGRDVDYSPGIGVDVGIKTFITAVNRQGNVLSYEKFIDDEKIKKYDEKIEKFQKIISKKMEINYNHLVTLYMDKHNELPNERTQNIMKGESYSNSCKRLQLKINRLKEKKHNYKKDKIDKYVLDLVKRKPEYITIENLSVKNLLENDASSTLHKYIQDSMFRYFFNKLEFKCFLYNIELRRADKFFASSKKCCICGRKNKSLKLSDRIYTCECGNTIDRDLNAAINLCNLHKYEIVV